MKKSINPTRYILLFALIFAMLGAVCYSPIVRADSKTVAKNISKESDSEKTSAEILTITQHVLCNISFSFECNAALLPTNFECTSFGSPFEVFYKIISASFQNSYLENIFPFAISAQAP